eukprot:scaffold23591_cov52-Cyclotella_meneghiniana.AAC.4
MSEGKSMTAPQNPLILDDDCHIMPSSPSQCSMLSSQTDAQRPCYDYFYRVSRHPKVLESRVV